MSNVETRVRALATELKDGLSKIPNVVLKTNLEPELSGGVVKIAIGAGSPKPYYDALWEKYRLSTAMTPSGDSSGIRISPHIYNTREELGRVIAAVRTVAATA